MLTVYSKETTSFSTLGIGVLRDFISHPLITEELNGAYTLEFEYAKDGYLSEYLIEQNIIKADGQAFRIWNIKKDMQKITVFAKHIFFDLSFNFLADVFPTNLTAQSALAWMLNRAAVATNFSATGNCTQTASTRYVRKNFIDAVFNEDNALLKKFGGELSYDNFNITVHEHRGTNANFSIRYKKNLTGIDFNLDFSNVATRIVPIGFDGLTIDSTYVESPRASNYFTPLYKTYEFNDIKYDPDDEEAYHTLAEAKQALINAANDLFTKNVDLPQVSIGVNFVELSKCSEYASYSNLETVHLGDTIDVIIPELNIHTSARVNKTVYDCTLERFITLEIGSAKQSIARSQIVIENQIRKSENYLTQAQQNAENLINHPFNGNVYIDKENGVIYLMDSTSPETAQNVWKWSLGGLGFSSTGINGTYTVAILQDGRINADFITTGQLDTGVIQGYDSLLIQVDTLDREFQKEINPTGTASGSSITLEDSAEAELIDFELEGKTEQATGLLPKEYTQVGYIQSSGTQYIDLNYIFTEGDIIEIEFEPLEANVDKAVFGAYEAAGKICELGFLNNLLRGNVSTTDSQNYLTNTIYKVKNTNGRWKYNDIGFGSSMPSSMTVNCYLFGRNYNGITKMSASKVYYLKIIRNNATLHFYIPCYRNSDNVIGMYDIVDNVFYVNNGTGNFSCGGKSFVPSPDYPSELISVGYENIWNSELENGEYDTNGNKIATSVWVVNKNAIEVEPNKTYTISQAETPSQYRIIYFNGNTYLSRENNTQNTTIGYKYYTFTTPNNCSKIYIQFRSTIEIITSGTYYITPNDITKEILLVGTQTYSYIPYGKYGIEVKTTGKNLFDKEFRQGAENSSVTTVIFSKNDLILNAGTYTFSCNLPMNTYKYAIGTNNNAFPGTASWLGGGFQTNQTLTFTLTETKHIGILVQKKDIGNISPNDMVSYQLMIELSSQATEYEPYKENTELYTLDEPLRSIGDTKDLLYIKNDMLYVQRKIGSIVLDGSESGWNSFKDNQNHYNYYIHRDDISKTVLLCLSNHFKYTTAGTNQINEFQIGGYNPNKNGNIIFNPFNDIESNLPAFLSWLSTHNIKIQYPLLESYIEELGQIQIPSTYKCITHINTTDELESNMTITYVKDTLIANYVESHVREIKITEQGIESRVQSIEAGDYGTRINAVEQRTTDTEHSIDIISTNIDTTTGEVRRVTTTTGFTFNEDGMTIEDSSSNFKALHRNTGTTYYDGSTVVGQYTKDGSKQKDLDLFGVYTYGKNDINDTSMFVAQLFTDENREECFGHFYNRGD